MRIPNTNKILAFMHCGECIKELPRDQAPRDFAQLEVGWTKLGLQVWCKRHECNVIHINFEGASYPANITRQKGKL